MELGILGALAYVGNKVNNNLNIKNESKINDSEIKYHEVDLTYHNTKNDNYKKNIKKILDKDLIKKSEDPKNTNIINNSIKSINNISYNNNKNMSSNFYEQNIEHLNKHSITENFNNNLNDNDMSYIDQFKPLSYDNKKLPSNVSSSYNEKNNDRTKQNLIERSLAIGGDYSLFDSEADDMTYGLLDKKDFTHSNMVPHFSKRQVINEYNEQTLAHKLDIFSGSSKNFVPKKEVLQENFNPVKPDNNLINGSKNNIDFLQSYYLPGKEKRNEVPFESDNVGPGLNLDPKQSIRPDGGLFEEYRPLPKTTNQLRSLDNPKLTYKGVIKPGQKGTSGRTIGKVYKRRPERTIEIDSNTFQKSGGEFKKQSARENFTIKDNKRKNSKQIIGPAKATEKQSSKNDQVSTMSTKKETVSQEPSNVGYLVKKATDKTCYRLPETRRENTESDKYISHPHKFSLSKVKFDPHDIPRQTVKQTTIFNEQSGYARGPENTNKSYNPNDVSRSTTKQTTIYNNQGGYTKGLQNSSQAYNPNDLTNPTIRQETTNNEQAGYAKGHENFTVSYNPNDLTNPTIRQETTNNEQAGYAKGIQNSTLSYNPNDITNPTIRQETAYTDQGGFAKGIQNSTISYNPNDTTNQTIRQETGYNEQSGYAKGLENFTISYNPNDITNPTIRQETINNEQAGYAKGIQNSTMSYNPNDLTNPTIRQETGYNEQSGYAKGHENFTISYNPNDVTNPTIRQETTHNEQSGYAKGHENFTVAYNPNDLLDNTQREDLVYNKNAVNTRFEVNRGETYNPNDLTNPTIRQELTHNKQNTNVKSDVEKPNYYDSSDTTRPTVKQSTIYPDRSGQTQGSNSKSIAFNPLNVPDKTLKDFLINTYELGVVQGVINRSTTFNPSDIPAETLKDMVAYNNYLSNPNREASSGYLSNKMYAPETLRQLMQILRYGGALGDVAPKNYSAAQNMQIDDKKENSLVSRDPTNRKHNVIPSQQSLGNIDLKNTIQINRSPNISNNSQLNNFSLSSTYNTSTLRNEESNRLNPDILNQLNDNPLVNNIVISKKGEINDDEDCFIKE